MHPSLLSRLVSVINAAFEDLRLRRPDLRMRNGARLLDGEDFVRAIRSDESHGTSFTVTVADEQARVKATASCVKRVCEGKGKPATVIVQGLLSPWACEIPCEPNMQDWELKMVAIHPSWQGRGVASVLLGAIEKEVILRSVGLQQNRTAARFAQSLLSSEEGSRLILSTIKEVNAPVFERLGFREECSVERGRRVSVLCSVYVKRALR
jgi:GNAT superfamily N-acetyltransferase